MSTAEQVSQQPGRPEDIKAVPVRHYGRWIAALVVAIVAASLVRSMAVNPRFHWDIVGNYLIDHRVLHGMWVTIRLTVLSMLIGVVLGVVLAVMRLSPNRLVSGASWFYIWFFRGTPLLVQILFWNNIAALYPKIAIGVPFGGPSAFTLNTLTLIPTSVAVVLALGLNEAAYMAEIVRAGILSVAEGQTEAAQSLGLRRLQVMRLIVLPQAIRVIVPPTGNEVISMLKNTALASVVAYGELLYAVQLIYGVTFAIIPMLLVSVFWYLVMTSVLYVVQYFIERRYGRGFTRIAVSRRWFAFGSGLR